MSTTYPPLRTEPCWTPELFRALSTAQEQAAAVSLLFSRRVPVFPCVPGEKRPLTRHGFKDASTDLADVAAWWSRWPDANIGVPTGSASGIEVVDVDVHQAGSGFAAFEKARAAGLARNWLWLVRTPSGGLHAYFPVEAGSGQRSWQVPSKHIDFRGDGGYIIVPPSAVADADGVGGVYQPIAVAEHHEAAPVDARALRAFLDPPRQTPRPAGLPAVRGYPKGLVRWVASIPEGGRNNGLHWAAHRMLEEGHDIQTAMSLLVPAALDAGLGEREAVSTVRSAYRSAPSVHPQPSPHHRHAIEGVGL